MERGSSPWHSPHDVLGLLSGGPGGPGGHPGPRPEWTSKDRSHSRSWSKSRGHKAWGKGRKHGKKD